MIILLGISNFSTLVWGVYLFVKLLFKCQNIKTVNNNTSIWNYYHLQVSEWSRIVIYIGNFATLLLLKLRTDTFSRSCVFRMLTQIQRLQSQHCCFPLLIFNCRLIVYVNEDGDDFYDDWSNMYVVLIKMEIYQGNSCALWMVRVSYNILSESAANLLLTRQRERAKLPPFQNRPCSKWPFLCHTIIDI